MLFAKLEALANEELITSLKTINKKERRLQAVMIAHLAEVRRRGLHLELGYKSLFAYCTQELGLDEGQVYTRTQVAKVCRRFPKVLELLAEGKMTMTAASRIAAHLTDDNHERLLRSCCGKTCEEIERMVAGLRPRPEYRASVRKSPKQAALILSESRLSEDPPLPTPAPQAELKAATPERFNIKFSARAEFKQLLERFAEVEGIDDVTGNLEHLLSLALEHGLDKKDPKRKQERRERREQKSAEKTTAPPKPKKKAKTPPSVARRVPAANRALVEKRAGYRCEYVSSSGTRCGQTKHLEVDHCRPWALGGGHEVENLQVLCSAHNKWKGAREFPGRFKKTS